VRPFPAWLPLDVQQALLDVINDLAAPVEKRRQEQDMLGEGSGHQALLLIEEAKKQLRIADCRLLNVDWGPQSLN
jgi:hypothetical protein